MSSRAVAGAAAFVGVAAVLAQVVVPQWVGFHSWQYAAALAIVATALGAYALGASRGEDGPIGKRLWLATVGALVVVAAGLASGLLGPDTEVIASPPGTVAPIADAGATAFFPVVDAATIAGGTARVALRRTGGGEVAVALGQRRFLGATAIDVTSKTVAYVDARTTRGEHLTVTQPTSGVFLSPVLAFPQRVTIAGKLLPADALAIPARHRQVKAFLFDRGLAHRGIAGGPAVLFAVDDGDGRPIPGAIGFAPSGVPVQLGGLRLTATVGTYPALTVSAVPLPLALCLGLALMLVGGLRTVVRFPFDVKARTLEPNGSPPQTCESSR